MGPRLHREKFRRVRSRGDKVCTGCERLFVGRRFGLGSGTGRSYERVDGPKLIDSVTGAASLTARLVAGGGTESLLAVKGRANEPAGATYAATRLSLAMAADEANRPLDPEKPVSGGGRSLRAAVEHSKRRAASARAEAQSNARGAGVTVAALYVATGGCYYGLPDVDPWDEERDARLYERAVASGGASAL